MSRVITLAGEVAAALADYGAQVEFIPDFRLTASRELSVAVVPAGTQFKVISRGMTEEKPCIHIGFARKTTGDDVPLLVNTVQSLGNSFLNRRFGDSICTEVVFDPIYSPSHLREKGMFLSVIELTFKAAGA